MICSLGQSGEKTVVGKESSVDLSVITRDGVTHIFQHAEFSGTFGCHMDLKEFPYDTQVKCMLWGCRCRPA